MLAWVWSPPKFIPRINHYFKKKKIGNHYEKWWFYGKRVFFKGFFKGYLIQVLIGFFSKHILEKGSCKIIFKNHVICLFGIIKKEGFYINQNYFWVFFKKNNFVKVLILEKGKCNGLFVKWSLFSKGWKILWIRNKNSEKHFLWEILRILWK